MEKVLLGIDIGTQGLRVGLFDLEGRPIGYCSMGYDTQYPEYSWAEQNPMDWWNAAKYCCQKVLADAKLNKDQVVGISLDSFSCTVLAVDHNSTPLHPALIWMDIRAVKEAEEITATGHSFLKYAGEKLSPEWMLPKALWLKRNLPDVYRRADKIVECTDWFMYKLTGHWTMSLDHISSKWNYVKSQGGWPLDLLKKIGLEDLTGKWPREIKRLGEYVGDLTREAAEELGLRAGTPVAQGGIDAHLGMVGLGAVNPGDMALILGSSTCHMTLSPEPVFGSGVWGPFDEAILPGSWTLEGGQTATGSIINWFKANFGKQEELEAREKGVNTFQVLDAKADRVKPGSEGLIVLDYWQGNRSPIRDPKARGLILGLNLKHGTGHIFRAIMESTAFGTKHILDALQEKEFVVKRLLAGGGGTQSKLWLQIHADITGLPIIVPEQHDSMALGSAMCAAVGAGIYKDLQQAVAKMVNRFEEIQPNQEHREIYDFYYDKYKRIYSQTKEVMHEIVDFNN